MKILLNNEKLELNSHSTEVTGFILLFSEVTNAISFERRNLGKKNL